MKTIITLLAAAAMLALSLAADVLTLSNGKKVTGTFLGGDSRTIRMEVNNKIETFQISEVASVSFGSAAAAAPAEAKAAKSAAAPAATAASTAAASSSGGWGTEPEKPAAAGPKPQTRPAAPGVASTASAGEPSLSGRPSRQSAEDAENEIPTGTLVQVRMIDSIDSSVHQAGETFRASLEAPITVGDKTVVPKGSDVTLRLMEAQGSGRIQGRALLKVEAVSVRVGGRSYPIFTEAAVTEGDSRTSESAKVIGGTAAVGAIIGAIAGGGKGAAIGAAAGAGAGTGVQVLRGSESIKVPTESLVTFRTTQSVRIY